MTQNIVDLINNGNLLLGTVGVMLTATICYIYITGKLPDHDLFSLLTFILGYYTQHIVSSMITKKENGNATGNERKSNPGPNQPN
jgi:hypothetical protein